MGMFGDWYPGKFIKQLFGGISGGNIGKRRTILDHNYIELPNIPTIGSYTNPGVVQYEGDRMIGIYDGKVIKLTPAYDVVMKIHNQHFAPGIMFKTATTTTVNLKKDSPYIFAYNMPKSQGHDDVRNIDYVTEYTYIEQYSPYDEK